MNRKSPAALQRQVATWNKANPIGTRVLVMRDNHTWEKTTTRSAAWVMSEHSAMIMLDGISGGYSLDRVTAFKTPRCDKLRTNALDSNDLRAWQTLAEQLEHDLVQERRDRIEEARDFQRDARDIAAEARAEGAAEAGGDGWR